MLEVFFEKVEHDMRPSGDGQTYKKVMRARFRIGRHRFTEEVDDGPNATTELQARAEQLRVQLEQLPGA
jgi:hypothetical protein